MKKQFVGVLSILSLLTISGSSLCAAFLNKSTDASETYATSLPKNINLNAYTASEIRSYYSDLNTLSDSERHGTNLLKNLKPILKNNMQWYSYDQVWRVYEITDRNWELSPASDTIYGTYDSSTNIISNYEFYSSFSTEKNNPYIHLMYSNGNNSASTSIKIQTSSPSHGADGGIDREHMWSKSIGFPPEDDSPVGPAGTDVHHLMAAEHTVNSVAHGNYCYGNVSANDDTWESKISTRPLINQNKRCKATATASPTGSTYLFEPQDCDKGDIARALFYMVARYNNYAGETGVISQEEPFLALDNNIYNYGTGFTTDDDTPAYYGCLDTLLEWNRLDPPDEYEIHRNDLIMRNFQRNRNPFVDFPQWADMIWGDDENSANPSTDTIYTPTVIGQLTEINVTNEPTQTNYFVGDDFDTTGVEITASYSDKEDAVVTDNCSFSPSTFTTSGTQDVTVSYTENGITKTTTIEVNVSNVELSFISISSEATKKTYYVGDEVDIEGLKVNANYNNGIVIDVTDDISYSPQQLDTAGTQTITISYTDDNITKTTSYNVTVNEPIIESIEVTSLPNKVNYVIGDTLNTTGLIITGTYDNGDQENVTNQCSFTPTTLNTAGKQYITVAYGDTSITTTFYVTVTNEDTEYFIDDTYTLAADVTSGKYLLGANTKSDETGTSYVLSAETIENSTAASTKALTQVTSFSYQDLDKTETLQNVPFTISLDSSNNVSVATTTKYIKQGSKTAISTVNIADTEDGHFFTLQASTKRLNVDDTSGTILYTASTNRGIIARFYDSNVAGNYASSNFTGAEYSAFRFYKVEATTNNFLIDKLEDMTCDNMVDKTHHDRLVYLHDNLTSDELAALSSTYITCVDGKTYTAAYAYSYAINQYSLQNSLSKTLLGTDIGVAEITVAVVSVISLGFIALFLQKRAKRRLK